MKAETCGFLAWAALVALQPAWYLWLAPPANGNSAHRTPDGMFEYAQQAASRGLAAIIAGAGGAAHLPGMLAAKTRIPVLGVPVQSQALNGLDSLLSIVQMPAGIPVATFAIGRAGAVNAALCAAAMLAVHDAALAARVDAFRVEQTDSVIAHGDPRVE